MLSKICEIKNVVVFFSVMLVVVQVEAGDVFPALLFEQDSAVRALKKDEGVSHGVKRKVDMLTLDNLREGKLDSFMLVIDNSKVYFHREKRSRQGETTTWIGKNSQETAELFLTIGKDYFFGRLMYEGRLFRYRSDLSTGNCLIQEFDPASAVPFDDGGSIPEQGGADRARASLILKNGVANAVEDGSVIDVMVLYSSGLLGYYGSVSLVTGRIQHLIDLTNEVFINSKVSTRLRLVHSAEVAYSDTGSIDRALDDITENRGVFANVENLRDQFGADQVTLLRRYDGSNTCGLAWIMMGQGDPDQAYMIVADGEMSREFGYNYCEDLTYSHEFGHQFGCAHEPYIAVGSGVYPYSYGYTFNAAGTCYNTVMSYGAECYSPSAVPYFSNPRITLRGVPLGNALYGDNARTIGQTRMIVANYRPAAQPLISDPDPIPSVDPPTPDGTRSYLPLFLLLDGK